MATIAEIQAALAKIETAKGLKTPELLSVIQKIQDGDEAQAWLEGILEGTDKENSSSAPSKNDPFFYEKKYGKFLHQIIDEAVSTFEEPFFPRDLMKKLKTQCPEVSRHSVYQHLFKMPLLKNADGTYGRPAK